MTAENPGYAAARDAARRSAEDACGGFGWLVGRGRVYSGLEIMFFFGYQAGEKSLKDERDVALAEFRELKNFVGLSEDASLDDFWAAIRGYRDSAAQAENLRRQLDVERASAAGTHERLTTALGQLAAYAERDRHPSETQEHDFHPDLVGLRPRHERRQAEISTDEAVSSDPSS